MTNTRPKHSLFPAPDFSLLLDDSEAIRHAYLDWYFGDTEGYSTLPSVQAYREKLRVRAEINELRREEQEQAEKLELARKKKVSDAIETLKWIAFTTRPDCSELRKQQAQLIQAGKRFIALLPDPGFFKKWHPESLSENLSKQPNFLDPILRAYPISAYFDAFKNIPTVLLEIFDRTTNSVGAEVLFDVVAYNESGQEEVVRAIETDLEISFPVEMRVIDALIDTLCRKLRSPTRSEPISENVWSNKSLAIIASISYFQCFTSTWHIKLTTNCEKNLIDRLYQSYLFWKT